MQHIFNAEIKLSDKDIKKMLATHLGVEEKQINFFLRSEGDQRETYKVFGGAVIMMNLTLPKAQ